MAEPNKSDNVYYFEYHRKKDEEGNNNWELKKILPKETWSFSKKERVFKVRDVIIRTRVVREDRNFSLWYGSRYSKNNENIIQIAIIMDDKHNLLDAVAEAEKELDNFLSYIKSIVSYIKSIERGTEFYG